MSTRDPFTSAISTLLWVCAFITVLSLVGAHLGWQAEGPKGQAVVRVESVLSPENLRVVLTSAPVTATSFLPLGIVLVVALGAAVGERSGLFDALVRASLKRLPDRLLTPGVVLIGLVAHQLSDALMVVYFPLAGMAFAAKGRSPVLGVTVAFAAFSGSFAANLFPGEQDIVLLTLTHDAARAVDPAAVFNPLANWYFTAVIALAYFGVTWLIADKVLDRHFRDIGLCDAAQMAAAADPRLAPEERRGLAYAGLVTSLVMLGFALLVIGSVQAPLMDASQTGPARLEPAFKSLPLMLMLLFLCAGWAYGATTGALRSGGQVVSAMSQGVVQLAPYILAAVLIAHLVLLVKQSHLGEFLMLSGAGALARSQLPGPVLIAALVVGSALLDLLIGSASAKWAIMAPIIVPMFMLLGISPAMSTAAYRIGDGVGNVLTPLMPCVALVLVSCQAWYKPFTFNSLVATMAPFAAAYLLLGGVIAVGWSAFEAPLGPFASASYHPAPDGL
jgi:aminobenzoyl-glutamate transport protein